MASCGISVNVSNLGVQFQASASAFKALAGLTGFLLLESRQLLLN